MALIVKRYILKNILVGSRCKRTESKEHSGNQWKCSNTLTRVEAYLEITLCCKWLKLCKTFICFSLLITSSSSYQFLIQEHISKFARQKYFYFHHLCFNRHRDYSQSTLTLNTKDANKLNHCKNIEFARILWAIFVYFACVRK